jgi:16S rRNA processing protein RimM
MSLPSDYTLVGLIQKPYGLLGEVKIKPETFDFDRYESLERVFARDREGNITELNVRASRADANFWYLKFDDRRTPEAAADLSGKELLIDAAEKLELPEGMVYFSDLPGMAVIDETGAPVGTVLEVREGGPSEYIVVKMAAEGDTAEVPAKEIAVPWQEPFVRKIDKDARTVEMDLSSLRGVLF